MPWARLIPPWKNALAGDPVSAFGGILVANVEITGDVANEINNLFFEVIIAPSYTAEALAVLKTKKNRIIIVKKEGKLATKQFRSLLNGVIVQDKDLKSEVKSDMAMYPPGSTFKLVNGLIGLQEGVLFPSTRYSCNGGYPYGRGVGCHHHQSPLDLIGAVAISCNTYFCYVFRSVLDNPKFNNTSEALDAW